MKTIRENIEIKPFFSNSFDYFFKNLNLGIWDIETTGLNPSSSSLILSGIIDCNGAYSVVTQYLAETQSEEILILEKTISHLKSFDYILTYNGRHFDMNFLIKKCKQYSIDCSNLPYNLDLYLILNGHSSFREFLPNLKQSTVEQFMQIGNKRKDEITGKDSVDLYLQYEKTQRPDLEKLVLLHNHDDIIQLQQLLAVIPKCDLEKAMYKLGFPINKNYYTTSIEIKNSKLTVKGIQRNSNFNFSFFGDDKFNYTFNFDSINSIFTVEIPLIREQGAAYLDLQTFPVDINRFKDFSNYVNDYLIIVNKNTINYLEITHFVKELTLAISAN